MEKLYVQETAVLDLLGKRFTRPVIAETMGISVSRVRLLERRAYRKKAALRDKALELIREYMNNSGDFIMDIRPVLAALEGR